MGVDPPLAGIVPASLRAGVLAFAAIHGRFSSPWSALAPVRLPSGEDKKEKPAKASFSFLAPDGSRTHVSSLEGDTNLTIAVYHRWP